MKVLLLQFATVYQSKRRLPVLEIADVAILHFTSKLKRVLVKQKGINEPL